MRKKQSNIMLVLLILLFCAIGCATDEANRVYVEGLAPKHYKEVEVLSEEPDQPYVLIADLQACSSIMHIRKRAAKIGADAVIVVPVGGSYSRKEIWAGEDKQKKHYHRLIGSAIKYQN